MKILRAVLALVPFLFGVHALAEDSVLLAKDEPRHRPKLENEYVRVLDVEIPAGDETQLHTHDLNYAYLMVNSALLRNEVKGKPGTSEIKIPAGLVGYYRASEGAYTHRFTNIGTDMFHAIGIELLRPAPAPEVSSALADNSGYVVVLDNERVRAYKVTLEAGQSTPSVALPGPAVRVVGTSGRVEQQTAGAEPVALDLRAGAFEFRAKPSTQVLKNIGASRIEIYEFEIK